MSAPTSKRPRPNIDGDIAPFWEGVSQEKFLLVRCQDCGAWYWPFAYCRNCPGQPFGANMVWTEASGRGTVFTRNIHRVAFDPAFADDIPYVYAMIELDEGPMFGTNIINCDPSEVEVGRRVQIVFVRDEEDGPLLPKAELCDDAGTASHGQ
jgi:uncharacterized OB-fold protein